MSTHVLAIDLGSTGVKIAVVDDSGRVHAGAGEVLPVHTTADGGVEQDPNDWWAAIGRCTRRALDASPLDGADIGLIAVTSQYTSTTAVDSAGNALANTIMWMDRRGKHHNTAVDPEAIPRWLEIHGMFPSGNDDLGHVGLIRALWPDVYERAAAFVEPMDYVAARLTGTVTATQNTMFPMLSCDNRTWGLTEYSQELLAMSGLDPAKLPPLVPLGQPRGGITAEAAEHLGVSPRAVVTGATIDSVTTAVGTGAIDATRCGIVIGTTTVIATHMPEKRMDPEHGLTSAPSPLPGSWFLVAENGIGGKALDVFVNQLVHPEDGLTGPRPPDAFERVLAAAADAPVGANGVMFFPWLVGSMAPGFERNQRGGFAGLGLTSERRDLARAVLEGVALNAAWLLPHVSALAGHGHDHVTFGGGGASSPLWGQILADCFGVPVHRLADSSTTNAHGAALLALAECGSARLADVPSMLRVAEVHEPIDQHHAAYRELLPAFVDFHDRAAPFYALLPASSTKDPEA